MHKLRLKLVRLSVIYAGGIGVFCLIAPIFGYPLGFPSESIAVLKQILPIFIGFLVVGMRYFTGTPAPEPKVDAQRVKSLNMVLNWSFGLFTVLTVALFSAFGFSGSRWAAPGQGMSLDDFTLVMAILLSIVTGSIGLLVTFVFAGGETQPKPKG